MDEDPFVDAVEGEARCPDGCPNAVAPYCPMHEDPAIYKRDENSLHMVEAHAVAAARSLVVGAVERLRKRRDLPEIRVPVSMMDEWMVFARKVVLDSGEHTAEGEVERRVATWLSEKRSQDWARLDRLKERYMRFTGDVPQG